MSEEQSQGRQAQANQHRGRSVAEWTTLGVSITIVLALCGLVTYLYVARPDQPAVIEVEPMLSAVRHANNAYYVPVRVTNVGRETVESVRVAVTHTGLQAQSETSEFTINFLAGGASAEGTVVFSNDPARGDVHGSVISYIIP